MRRRTAVTVTIAALVGIVIWMLVAIPRYQVRGVTVEGPDRPAKTAALINEYRRTIVQVLGGVFFVVGALSGAYFTWRQITVAHEGQITDRFTKAVAQLGDNKLPVRIGGIYALERIARDSPKDRWTIVETLAAYVRELAPAPELSKPDPEKPDPEKRRRYRPATDVQAALTVLGRRPRRPPIWEPGNIDLSYTDLQGADLLDADLRAALFSGAHLEQANCMGAHLERADFYLAKLSGARFQFAYLENASLRNAHLKETDFRAAHLEGADFAYATDLTDEQLTGASVDDRTTLPASVTKRPGPAQGEA